MVHFCTYEGAGTHHIRNYIRKWAINCIHSGWDKCNHAYVGDYMNSRVSYYMHKLKNINSIHAVVVILYFYLSIKLIVLAYIQYDHKLCLMINIFAGFMHSL